MSAEGGGAGAAGGGAWTGMNENLMALLEAVLSLAASDTSTGSSQRPARNVIKAGGYSEEMFVDLSETEQEEFICNICYQILRESMHCLNRHKFCHSCLYVWSTTGQYANRVRCPVCRCQGLYYRDDEIDDRIQNKRVKCNLAGCRWVGPLKRLPVHRHTNYGSGSQLTRHGPGQREEVLDDDEKEERSGTNALELPYLGRASPHLLHRSQSRFSGTGLQARRLYLGTGDDETAYSDAFRLSTVDGTDTAPVRGGGGVLLRARRNANHTISDAAIGGEAPSQATEGLPSVHQQVHHIRRGPVNRIMVRHTDSNNNVAAAAHGGSNSPVADTEFAPHSPMQVQESGLSSPRQPRPPSGPRPARMSRRRILPGLSTASHPQAPSVTLAAEGSSPPIGHIIRAPPTFNAAVASSQAGGLDTLSTFQDRLQESRDRLEGLMANFSGELERSRQEMVDFQVERERQRREQLAEVRELGRRLGQVASELRHLLGHRRLRPSNSD